MPFLVFHIFASPFHGCILTFYVLCHILFFNVIGICRPLETSWKVPATGQFYKRKEAVSKCLSF